MLSTVPLHTHAQVGSPASYGQGVVIPTLGGPRQELEAEVQSLAAT